MYQIIYASFFIDDDEGFQTLLAEYFSKKGIEVVSVLNGAAGIRLLDEKSIDIDVVVLDLMMPEMDGFETLTAIRRQGDLPVIMLTALEEETGRIVGLEMGADDYLHKPINPRELLARVKANLRRTKAAGSDSPEKKDADTVPAPGGSDTMGIFLDPDRGGAIINGRPVELTRVEFDILRALMRSEGRIVTRDRLMDLSRGREFEAYDRSIDVHISRIRKKIEENPARPRWIKTVWGKGYKWEGDAV